MNDEAISGEARNRATRLPTLTFGKMRGGNDKREMDLKIKENNLNLNQGTNKIAQVLTLGQGLNWART